VRSQQRLIVAGVESPVSTVPGRHLSRIEGGKAKGCALSSKH